MRAPAPSRRSCCGRSTSSAIEIPSWGFVNTGTRFKVWQQPGTPRTVEEKIDDAGTVHRYTGIARTVALHIPWDKTDDYTALLEYMNAKDLGIGGINLNTFQDADYMLGSMCHPDPRRPRQGPRGPHRVLRDRRRRWVRRRSRSGSATAPTTPARTTCAGAATASSRACRRPTHWLPEQARM